MHLYILRMIYLFSLLPVFFSCLAAKQEDMCCAAYNFPAYPRCPLGCNDVKDPVVIRSDFLWWRACEEGIALGDLELIFDRMVSPSRSAVRDISHLKKMQFHYEPGFRLGFESTCACDCWGFVLNWTHFHSKATAHFRDVDALGNPEAVFISFWERGTELYPLYAASHWKLGMDLLDFEAGHLYYVSSFMAIRPFFGLRGARITQTYSTLARSNDDGNIGESGNFISRTKSRANFTALGPRCGFRIQFDLLCGWSVVGEAAASVVFGRSQCHSREYTTEFASLENEQDVVEFEYRTRHGFNHTSKAIADLSLGLHWNRCVEFCNRSHIMQLLIAWEHHLFSHFNAFDFASQGIAIRSGVLAPSYSKKQGDLSVQGLTASLQVGF